MLKRESDKGREGGKGPILGVRFPEMIWFLACLNGHAPIKTVKLRRKSSLAITTEVRRTHKIKEPAPQEGLEKQIWSGLGSTRLSEARNRAFHWTRGARLSLTNS